jgi:hypothetical protein
MALISIDIFYNGTCRFVTSVWEQIEHLLLKDKTRIIGV